MDLNTIKEIEDHRDRLLQLNSNPIGLVLTCSEVGELCRLARLGLKAEDNPIWYCLLSVFFYGFAAGTLLTRWYLGAW